MCKKVFAVLGACVLLTATAYAQRPLKMAKQSIDAMTGGVPSAFSTKVPVTLLNAEVVGNRVLRVQFSAVNNMYIASPELFKQVQASQALKMLSAEDVRLLEAKFNRLDEIVKLRTSAFAGYRGALLSERPSLREDVLLNPQVNSMLHVLDIQHYMQLNNNEFPQLFTVNKGGWLLATNIWSSSEGNKAIRQVLDLLIKEQAGQVDVAVVSQLTALYAGASNAIPVKTVVEQLQNWRAAHNTTTNSPKLPKDLSEVSLRSNAENLWLTMQIRLLQLTPGIELPEILKNAVVTQ